VEVRVRILPALFGRYEVSRVVLREPALTVIRTSSGLNTASLGGAGGPPAPEAPGGASAAPAAEPSAPAALLVALFDLRDGRVRFVDRTAKPPVDVTLDQLDVEASDLSPDTPVRIDLRAALPGSDRPNASLEGRVGPIDPSAPERATVDLELALDPLRIEELSRIPEIAAALPEGLAVQGPLRLDAKLTGNLAKLAVAATFDASEAAVALPPQLDKAAGVPLSLGLRGLYGVDELQIEEGRLTLADAALDASGRIGLGEPPRYQLDLRSQGLPLASLGRVVAPLAALRLKGSADAALRASGAATGAGLPALDGQLALQNVEARPEGSPAVEGLSTTLRFAKGGAELPPTRFRLGGSPVEVSGQLPDLARPRLQFSVRSDALRAASLGFAGEGVSRPEELRGFVLDGTLALSDSGPRLDAQLRSSEGSLRDVDYRDLSAKLAYADDRARIDDLVVHAYGGRLVGSGSYDRRDPEKPVFQLDTRLENLAVQPLVASRAGRAAGSVEGQLHGDLQLSGAGSDWEAIRRVLTGHGSVKVTEGRLKDVNVAESVLQSITGVPGLSGLLSPGLRARHPALFATGDTVFDALQAAVEISEGFARTRGLRIAAQDYVISGDGRIGLDGALDLSARLTASDALSRDLVQEVRASRYLAGRSGRIEVPFRLSGRLPDAKVRPDLEGVTQAVSGALVGNLLEKALGVPPAEKAPEAVPPAPAEGAPPPQAPPPTERPPPVDPTEELIRRGLEGLLKR
jgi:hypothetical protein